MLSSSGDPHTDGKPPVLCIVGATGVGKSDVAVAVAKAVGGEVVSADSMQIYRGMDIGTAKLTEAEMQGVPHHLIDIVDPDTPFTVADWTRRADQVIAGIHARGRLPIVVGGTGLYIRAIVEDLDFATQVGSTEVRARWQRFVQEQGNEALHAALARVDEVSAQRLHPNDVRRVIRALEVAEARKRPLSDTYDWRLKGGRYRTLQFGLAIERDGLNELLDARVDRMLARGLEDEVAGLLAAGYDRGLTSMQAIGYKEVASYVCGEWSRDEAIAKLKQATRRFAKRQRSWFRRDTRIQFITRHPGVETLDELAHPIVAGARELSAGIPDDRLE